MGYASDEGGNRPEVCIQKSRLTPLGMKTKDIPDSSSVMVGAALPDGCKPFGAERNEVSRYLVVRAMCVGFSVLGFEVLAQSW